MIETWLEDSLVFNCASMEVLPVIFSTFHYMEAFPIVIWDSFFSYVPHTQPNLLTHRSLFISVYTQRQKSLIQNLNEGKGGIGKCNFLALKKKKWGKKPWDIASQLLLMRATVLILIVKPNWIIVGVFCSSRNE